MPEYSPETILLLRQLERKTQSEIAIESKTTQGRLSKVINGLSDFEDSLARSISLGEDYPLSFFTSTPEIFPITGLTYRHTSRSSMSELNSIGVEYSILVSVVGEVARAVQLNPSIAWIKKIAPTDKNLSSEQIEKLAQETRKGLGLPESGAIGNVTHALEKRGIVVAPLRNLSRHEDSHLNSDGVTYPQFDHIPVIGFASTGTAGDRERFTKAHELAHLILHRNRRPNTYKEMESEAHRFAGAFLMPFEDANIVMTPYIMLSEFMRLKATWGMSIASLVSRARNAGVISYDRYRSLYMQISSRGWRKSEPVDVGIEHPVLFKKMIAKKYADDDGRVDYFSVQKSLKIPFRYLDMWSNGLEEQGSEIGFYTSRFATV